MTTELVIDENNFDQYFFDARRNKPKKGQVLAKYSAAAELVDGRLKRDIISLLKMDKAKSATQVLQKLGGAKSPYHIKVCREIAEDLAAGISDDEIAEKPYHFYLEHLFYAEKQYIPLNDPHWETIDLLFDRKDLDKQIKNLTEKEEVEDI